nr:MAG TPA: hypothetical protein [Caudoviricetes sp.]
MQKMRKILKKCYLLLWNVTEKNDIIYNVID